MNYAIEIDAADVLGVPAGASLQDIRDAYRARVKKHHPDVGGDEWAFRAVARAYEVLSHARLQARVGFEPAAPTAAPPPTPHYEPFFHAEPHDDEADDVHEPGEHAPIVDEDSSFVRAGVEDRVGDPSSVVDVELFTIRYEFEGPINLLASPSERNLSSCLHVTWPAPPAHDGEPEAPADPETLRRLARVFVGIPRRTKAIASWSRSDDGRFLGWLSYPSANSAFEAFEALHAALNAKGLGVRQSSRELFIARGPR